MSMYCYKGQDGKYLLGAELDEVERTCYRKHMVVYYTEFILAHELSKCLQDGDNVHCINLDAVLYDTKKMVDNFAYAEIPECFGTILNSDLSKNEQEKLLNGVTLTDREWDAIFYKAEEKGYTYSFYKYVAPIASVEGKTVPDFIYKNKDGKVEYFGNSTLSDKHMAHIVENTKTIIARIIDRGNHWYCFVQTMKGVRGHEGGKLGSKSHIHYISDKFGISRDDLVAQIHEGHYPTDSVHILLADE